MLRVINASKLLIILLVYLSHSPAHSQQLNFRSFSFADGLNTYNIRETVQDKYGFMWIATQDGLYRYNGTTFEAIRKGGNSIASLQENFVMDIYYGGDDTLYAATFNGGVDAIDIRTLSVVPLLNRNSDSCNSLPNLWINKIFKDAHNQLWIGGQDYLTIYGSGNQDCIRLTSIKGFAGAVNVAFIVPINEKIIAVGVTDFGILLYDIKTLALVGEITNFFGSTKKACQVTDVLVLGDKVFLSSNLGIIKGRFSNFNWVFEELLIAKNLDGCIVSCMTKAAGDEIWIGSNCGIGRLNIANKNFYFIASQMGQTRWLTDNTVRHLTIDKQNNLWISTSKVLQSVNLNPNPFTYFTGTNVGNSKMDHVYALVAKSDNEIFATATDGLYITNLTSGQVDKVKGTQSLGVIHFIMNIEPNLWLISSDLGMYPYIPGKGILSQDYLLKLYPEWKPYIRNYFNTSIRISSKIYWASEEQEGLLVWDLGNRKISKHKAFGSENLPENHIHNMRQDREGNLWLLSDNSVAKFDINTDSVSQVISYTGQPGSFNSGIFFDAFDDGTTIWFGTYSGGINGYNKKTGNWQYITEKDGLCNNAVYGILPEKDSVFWVSTNMGISRVNYVTKKCINYFFEDGLQDNSFDEMGVLAMGRRLFFGGINGFTMLDLDRYQIHPKIFPVYIHRVEYYAKGRKKVYNQLEWQSLVFPAQTSSITIHLSALAFSNNRKIQFSYKIKDNEDEYIPVSEDNKIVLNAMNSGEYQVSIRYLNEAGDFVTNDLKFDFYISPIWYETWWFRALLVAMAIALTYAIYRYRINQVLQEQKIRKAIASDLHDDIGSTLSSAKMLTHLAVSSPDRIRLTMIESNLEQASTNLRDLLWVLDDRLDTIFDLIERLKKYSLPLAQAVNVSLEFTCDEDSRNYLLSKAEKKNLYLIAKEAINNSLKYAKCKRISVRFALLKKKLSVNIEDDGNGFNVEEVEEGYGLRNMVDRAKQINFSASIHSDKQLGTTIVLNKS